MIGVKRRITKVGVNYILILEWNKRAFTQKNMSFIKEKTKYAVMELKEILI